MSLFNRKKQPESPGAFERADYYDHMERSRDKKREAQKEHRRKCIDGAEEYYAGVVEDHKKRVEGFSFEASRQGDWLTVIWSDQGTKSTRVVNLAFVTTISVSHGVPHSLTGGRARVSPYGYTYGWRLASIYDYGLSRYSIPDEFIGNMPTPGEDGSIEFVGPALRIPLPFSEVERCYQAIMDVMPIMAGKEGE